MIALISNSCQNHVDIEITNNNYTIIFTNVLSLEKTAI